MFSGVFVRASIAHLNVCVCVLGGPGSGKALQCEKMEERYGLRRLCPGDMLCTELQSHSERGRFLRDLLERGRQLPEVWTPNRHRLHTRERPDPFILTGFHCCSAVSYETSLHVR